MVHYLEVRMVKKQSSSVFLFSFKVLLIKTLVEIYWDCPADVLAVICLM